MPQDLRSANAITRLSAGIVTTDWQERYLVSVGQDFRYVGPTLITAWCCCVDVSRI